MNRSILAGPVVILGAALLITSCSSSPFGQGAGSGVRLSATAAGGVTSSGANGATATEVVGLAAKLTKGLQGTTSLHLDLVSSVLGQQITASGDESLANGAVTAAHLAEAVPTVGDIEIVIIGSQVYAKLPAALQGTSSSDKPWLLADPNSTNPVAKELGQTSGSLLSQSSVGSYNAFVSAATSVKNDGSDPVDGLPATHYSIVVDINKLPADNPSKAALITAGLTSVPVEMWIDSHDRLVQVTEDIAVSGVQTSTKITISKYDEPVTITAPPADQVSTD
jgi:hypothetical protein